MNKVISFYLSPDSSDSSWLVCAMYYDTGDYSIISKHDTYEEAQHYLMYLNKWLAR